MNKYNSYTLLVLEEIKSDPFLYKDNHIVNYHIPGEEENLDGKTCAGKIVAVLDLRDLGAVKIRNEQRITFDNNGKTEIGYEFELLVIHPAFESVYERCLKEVHGKSVKGSVRGTKEFCSLRIYLNGEKLCISGIAVNNQEIIMCRIRLFGSGAIVGPLFRACSINPIVFKSIVREDLQTKSTMKDAALNEALKNIPLFKRYISNLGLKGDLKSLFYGNSPHGLTFKFRVAVPQQEWASLTEDTKSKVVNYINSFSATKK